MQRLIPRALMLNYEIYRIAANKKC